MFACVLLGSWAGWVAALAAPLHRRLAWRPPVVVAGPIPASGRRTATGWWRAARLTTGLRPYHCFLDVVGREADAIAAVLLRLTIGGIRADGPPLSALDDTPTRRHGPEARGAGVHHDPTPGPAGSKFLHGHDRVSLDRVARHDLFGTIGLPLPGRLYVRRVGIPKLPESAGASFRTRLRQAAGVLKALAPGLPRSDRRPRVVVDGAYSRREFPRPTIQGGSTVARSRKDAALTDLPPTPVPGAKRGRGRPPTCGRNALSLAKRAGRKRAWGEATSRSASGREVWGG